MSRKRLSVVLVSTILILALVLGLSVDENEGADRNTGVQQITSATPSEGAQSAPLRSSNENAPSGRPDTDARQTNSSSPRSGAEVIQESVRSANNARSAGAYVHSLLDLANYQPYYAAKKAHEVQAVFCNPESIAAAADVGMSTELVEQRKSFCEDLDGAIVDRILDIANSRLPNRNDQVEELLVDHPIASGLYELESRLSEASEGERSEVFTELARGASTPEGLMDLARMNFSHASEGRGGASPIWEIGRDIQEDRFPLANLPKAQSVALGLYSCDRFGGCREGQLMRMTFCGNRQFGGRCPSGASVEDLLYMTTSPADWMLAMEILQKLRSP